MRSLPSRKMEKYFHWLIQVKERWSRTRRLLHQLKRNHLGLGRIPTPKMKSFKETTTNEVSDDFLAESRLLRKGAAILLARSAKNTGTLLRTTSTPLKDFSLKRPINHWNTRWRTLWRVWMSCAMDWSPYENRMVRIRVSRLPQCSSMNELINRFPLWWRDENNFHIDPMENKTLEHSVVPIWFGGIFLRYFSWNQSDSSLIAIFKGNFPLFNQSKEGVSSTRSCFIKRGI